LVCKSCRQSAEVALPAAILSLPKLAAVASTARREELSFAAAVKSTDRNSGQQLCGHIDDTG